MAARRSSSAGRAARRPPKLVLPRPRAGRRLAPGLVRLDYDKVRGYIVRIGYIRTKTGWRPRHKAYFSDVRFGGKAKAKAAAEAWLKGLIRTGRPPEVRAPSDARGKAPVRRRTAKRR